MRRGWLLLSVGLACAAAPPTLAYADEKDEENITIDQVPEAARHAIEREAKGGKIDKLEKEKTARGTEVYEAHITKNGKHGVVAFDAQGKLVPHEEKHEKD